MRAVIAPELSPEVECVELLHLTPLPTAMTRVRRQQTAEVAVRRAVELQSSGRHLLLAGDPIPAAEVVAAPSAPRLDAIAVCLLDATPEAQAERLATRGDPAELLVHHQAFAEWMRRQASDPLYMTHVVCPFRFVASAATGPRLLLRVLADLDQQSRPCLLQPSTRPVVRESGRFAVGRKSFTTRWLTVAKRPCRNA